MLLPSAFAAPADFRSPSVHITPEFLLLVELRLDLVARGPEASLLTICLIAVASGRAARFRYATSIALKMSAALRLNCTSAPASAALPSASASSSFCASSLSSLNPHAAAYHF